MTNQKHPPAALWPLAAELRRLETGAPAGMRRAGAGAILGVALLAADPASAQAQSNAEDKTDVQVAQAQPSGGDKPKLPQITVEGKREEFRTDATRSATRTDTPLRDIPQFINTVPEALIRSQNATQLSDALRNVPGISYAAAEGGTQANQVFYLRGFPAGGDLFLDNIRDIGEYNRDLFATESVEVLKGPSSLMFGRGSTGGVINQVSKVAGLMPLQEVGLTLGSFDQKRLEADINVRTGASSAFRVAALGEDSGSYRHPRDVKRLGVAPNLRLGIGEKTEMLFSLFYLKTEDVTDYGQPSLSPAVTGTGLFAMPPVSPRNYYGYANHDYTDHETTIGTFRIEHRATNDLSVRNTLRIANYKRQVEATIATLRATDIDGAPLTPATPLSALVVTRNHDGGRTRDNDDDAFINQTELVSRFSAWGMRHTLLAGLELGKEELHRWNYALDANPDLVGVQVPTSITSFLSPDPYTQLSYTKTPNVRARAEADTVAVYVQDQFDIAPTWKALLGIRWEDYDAQTHTENYLTGAPVSGPFGRSDEMLSGRAGLIWQPSARQSYYIAVGNSYNPSGELGVYGGTGTNLSAINQNLDPEENRNYELGSQWDFASGLQLRASLFRTEKINARMADPVLGTTVLAGKRRVDGLELQLTGRLTPEWDVYSGLAFMDGEIITGPATVQGKVPLGVPDVSGSLWTVYRLPRNFEVGGGLRYSSGFWLNDANTGEVPSYTVWDATVAYVQEKYEVRLNVNNITDKTYYVGGYNNNLNRVLPGAPRSASITLRYRFI